MPLLILIVCWVGSASAWPGEFGDGGAYDLNIGIAVNGWSYCGKEEAGKEVAPAALAEPIFKVWGGGGFWGVYSVIMV